VSVPYPGNGPTVYGQNREHLIGVASRYVTEHLDHGVRWEEIKEYLQESRGLNSTKAGDITLIATLDLEWSGTVFYDHDHLRRPLPGDARQAPLEEVAKAVMALGWTEGQKSRSIWKCFVALNGRYRHCDVYWAMHEVLKGSQLRCFMRNWWPLSGVDVLADPALLAALTDEERKQYEAELVEDYVDWLGLDVETEWPVGSRSADIYDPSRRLIIEAKIDNDDVVVLGAVVQAALYRRLANRDKDQVDPIAVLLPREPSELVRETLRVELDDLQVGFIWRKGGKFVEELV